MSTVELLAVVREKLLSAGQPVTVAMFNTLYEVSLCHMTSHDLTCMSHDLAGVGGLSGEEDHRPPLCGVCLVSSDQVPL